MAKRKIRKKEKDVDINIKVDNLEKLAKVRKKWDNKKDNWRCHGIGVWGFGSALAIVLSYFKNSSIFWAILHGILSWFYVIFRIIVDYGLFS